MFAYLLTMLRGPRPRHSPSGTALHRRRRFPALLRRPPPALAGDLPHRRPRRLRLLPDDPRLASPSSFRDICSPGPGTPPSSSSEQFCSVRAPPSSASPPRLCSRRPHSSSSATTPSGPCSQDCIPTPSPDSMACYTAALPFYRNDLVSTAIVAGFAFGIPEALKRHEANKQTQTL